MGASGASLAVVTVVVVVASCSGDDSSSPASRPSATSAVVSTSSAGPVETTAQSRSAGTPATTVTTAVSSSTGRVGSTSATTTVAVRVDPVFTMDAFRCRRAPAPTTSARRSMAGFRGAQVLEAAIEKKIVNLDDKLYEKLANCWIRAGEYDKAIPPLTRAAELATTGDGFVRLGEVQAQREDWPATIAAIERGVAKGQLRDAANAQLWLGIAHYTQKNYTAAVPFFERSRQTERYRQTSQQYLDAIRVARQQD